MRRLITVLCFVFAVSSLSAQCCATAINCVKTDTVATDATNVGVVKAYYFHATRRCVTCEAVESVTSAALKEFYGAKVPFQSINRDEDKTNPLIEKYKVSGQTLLLIKGDKVVNLTNDAFMNARTNPDKFKQKLKATIDSML